MSEPKFKNGQLVILDPLGSDRGPRGKILGTTHYIDGTFGYVVSCSDFGSGGIVRHYVSEYELVAADE
jgi:hypothetical protein